jgi:hypothetical protein
MAEKKKDCVIKICIAGRLENGKLLRERKAPLNKAVFVGF